jgi:UDP-N-acetylmuramoylalanine--D-glutamate ligase
MIALLPNSKVAVIGLGRVGRMVSQYLLHEELNVYAYDDNSHIVNTKEIEILQNNRSFKLQTVLNKTLNQQCVITSPGLYEKSKAVQFLRKNNITLIDEIEFTAVNINNPIIAITGTNGKSTTTALLGRILQATGKNVFWGGNLAPGMPFVTALFHQPHQYYVIEISSFQLERVNEFRPHIAILTNITADHLDRHSSLNEYRKIKFKLFQNQDNSDYAIINMDDPISVEYHKLIESQRYFFSKFKKVNGAYIKDNNIFFNNENICPVDVVKLPGSHYVDSILAAVCAAKIAGIRNSTIARVLNNFGGIEHRLELVREYEGVKYINNSMCTNPTAGAANLNSFRQKVILIAGGKEKKLEVNNYVAAITQKSKFTVLIGENRYRLADLLESKQYMNFKVSDTMTNAIMIAKENALSGDIVLFSPGFASFDTYVNFQERGNAFKNIIYGIT